LSSVSKLAFLSPEKERATKVGPELNRQSAGIDGRQNRLIYPGLKPGAKISGGGETGLLVRPYTPLSSMM